MGHLPVGEPASLAVRLIGTIKAVILCGVIVLVGPCLVAKWTPASWAGQDRETMIEDDRAFFAIAGELDASQLRTEGRLHALCGLADKAAPFFPDLSRRFIAEALAMEGSLDRVAGLDMVAGLEVMIRNLPKGPLKTRGIVLMENIGQRCRSAWRLRLIAESALSTAPDYSELALNLALRHSLLNTDSKERDRELANLAVDMARRQPWRAWVVAARIEDEGARSRAYRLIWEGSRSWIDLESSLMAARAIKHSGQRALALARLAAASHESRPRWSGELFVEAFNSATQEADVRKRALLEASIAAMQAREDPEKGISLAFRVKNPSALRFEAYRRAAQGLQTTAPERCRQAWLAAWHEVKNIPSPRERARASSLVIQDVARYDSELARKMLLEWPKGEFFLRAEAEAATLLAGYGEELVRITSHMDGLQDPLVRFRTLSRLALIEQGSAVQVKGGQPGGLRKEILDTAAKWRDMDSAPLLLPGLSILDQDAALELLGRIPNPLSRSALLVRLAGSMRHRGDVEGASKVLEIALWEIFCSHRQQTLDKVRILGDMGRGWALIEPSMARRVFLLAAEAIHDLSLNQPAEVEPGAY